MKKSFWVKLSSTSIFVSFSFFTASCGREVRTHISDSLSNELPAVTTDTSKPDPLSKAVQIAPAASAAPASVPSTTQVSVNSNSNNSAASAAQATTSNTTPNPGPLAAPNPPSTSNPKPVATQASPTPTPLSASSAALLKKLTEYRHPSNSAIQIPVMAAEKFLRFIDHNKNKTFDAKTYDRTIGVQFDNLKYGVIIDYTAPSTRRRLFFIDLKTGETNAYYVAHGKGSVASAKDLSKWSKAQYFSNTEDSKASSLGFFISGESYDGKHGLSLRLHGIEKSNSRAFDRAIVMHGAEYVGEDVLAANANKYMGMSWGCPALGQGAANKLIPLLAGGAVIFAYHETDTPVAETKPYLLEPPKILAMIMKSMPTPGPINIGKIELPNPEDDTLENEMPGEDHSPGAQAGNSAVKESEKD